jgi:putative addiction module CopG family antidote
MNVSLAPELERFLNEQVRNGRYASPEEAVSRAVELLKETEEAESRMERCSRKPSTAARPPR